MKTRRLLAVLLTAAMLFEMLPMSVFAAGGSGDFILDREGNVIRPETGARENPDPTDKTWEEVYEFGAFAFGDFQANLTEGDSDGLETVMIPVYRLGGTDGRAEVTVRYTPAVSQISDDLLTHDYAAFLGEDLLLDAEDANPAAAYQPLAVPRVTPAYIMPAHEESGDEEYPVALSVPGVDAESWQWEIFTDGEWMSMEAQKGETLLLSAEDLTYYDFRCVYKTAEGWFGTDSVWGEAYVPFTEELPAYPEDESLMEYETSFSPLTPEGEWGEAEVTLTFAAGELVKYIRATVVDDELPELQEMGLLTLVSHRGAEIDSQYSTLTVSIADNEEKAAAEIGFEAAEVRVDQDESTAVLTVKRTGGLNYLLTAHYETADGTAKAGEQYAPVNGELTFIGDMDTLEIKVPLIAEEARAEDLAFSVVLSDLKGGENHLASFGTAEATVTLTSTGGIETMSLIPTDEGDYTAALSDGLNLASVLASGEAGADTVYFQENEPLIGEKTVIAAEQEEQELSFLPGVYHTAVQPTEYALNAAGTIEPNRYTGLAGYTFFRIPDYNGWHDWEKVTGEDEWIKKAVGDDVSATMKYWNEFHGIADSSITRRTKDGKGEEYELNKKESIVEMIGGHNFGVDFSIKNGGILFDRAAFRYHIYRLGFADPGGVWRNRWGAPWVKLGLGKGKSIEWDGNVTEKGTKEDDKEFDEWWFSNSDGGTSRIRDKGDKKGNQTPGSVALYFGGDVSARYTQELHLTWNRKDDEDQENYALDSKSNDKGYTGDMDVKGLAYRRRVFTQTSLPLVVCTANDADMANSNYGQITRLDVETYPDLQPIVYINQKNGGVNENNQLYVGTQLIVELPDKLPAGFSCMKICLVEETVKKTSEGILEQYAYVIKHYTDAIKNKDDSFYTLTMLWDGITEADLSRNYKLYVVYNRTQEIELDVTPSIPRDKDGNPSTKLEDIASAWSHFTSPVTVQTSPYTGTVNDYMVDGLLGGFGEMTPGFDKKLISSNLSAPINTATTMVWSGLTNVQTVCFHQDPNDVILHAGKSYPGDAVIPLTEEDLMLGRISFKFYDSAYTGLPTKMVTSIVSTAICYDGDGNGRIDGYYDGVRFIIDKDSKDSIVAYVNDGEFDENFFTVEKEGDNVRQYFLKVFYQMTPRCLTVPTGANENDTVRVLPAFVSTTTSKAGKSKLTREQDTYRYIQAGEGRYDTSESYADTSAGQLMYQDAANKTRMVDIPLGGDLSPAKKSAIGVWAWFPNYYGNLLFDYEGPEPILHNKNITGRILGIALDFPEQSMVDGENVYTYKNGGDARLNNYLGAFYGGSTFALCVNEKNDLSSRADINPETVNRGRIESQVNSDYLGNVNGKKQKETKSDPEGKGAYPEFEMDIGLELPSLEGQLFDYVTITMDGTKVGFTIGLPIVGKEKENSAAAQNKDFADSNDNIGKILDFLKGPKQSLKDSWDSLKRQTGALPNDRKALKTSKFELGFFVQVAMMFEYNKVDDGFYFQSAGIAAGLEGKIRLEARLAPCPILYLYVVFGFNVELGTSINVTRVVKEGAPVTISSLDAGVIDAQHNTTLLKGEKISFTIRIGDNFRGFKLGLMGKVYLSAKPKEEDPVFAGQFKSTGAMSEEFDVLFPDECSKDGDLTVTITALEDTVLTRVISIIGADSVVYWGGFQLSPEISIEAGGGIGVELLKFELYIKVTLGLDLTFGAYSIEKDEYEPANMDSFDLSAAVGFNITAAFFNFSMDIIGYYLHGEMNPTTKQTSWSGHFGWVNGSVPIKGSSQFGENSADGAIMSNGSRTFGLSAPTDVSDTQHFVRSYTAGMVLPNAFDANDRNVPFQLSGYGASGDAFKLLTGLGTGYDYKAFSVNGETYILYPVSVGGAVPDPVDYTQLVMSRVVVTADGENLTTGLQHPFDSRAAETYMPVDVPDAEGFNTGDLDFDVDVDGSVVTVSFTSYENHAAGNSTVQAASRRVVTKRAVIDFGDADPAFTVKTLSKPGRYQFLPQQANDVTIYGVADDTNSSGVKAEMDRYAAYLNAKFGVSNQDLTAADPDPENTIPVFRYQTESVRRDLYGVKNSLVAVTADGTEVKLALEELQTLENVEAGVAGGVTVAAYTTTQAAYFDANGTSTSTMTAETDRGVIKRLYLCTFDGSAWSRPKLLRTVMDFDEHTSSSAGPNKDGIYTFGSLEEERADPYFANLQFLKAKISGAAEECFLFEMNGNTYLVRQADLTGAVAGGGISVTPLFTGEEGTEATIGSDNDGNLAVVYSAPVSGTVNNALYVAWWDTGFQKWGVGNILAMNHLQVKEDAEKYNLTPEQTELAFYGKATGDPDYDAYIADLSSDKLTHAQGAMDRFTFSDLQMTLNGTGKDATLVLLSRGTAMTLKETTFEAGGKSLNTVVNGSAADVGFYAISFGAGKQGIGSGRFDLVDYDFSAGSMLKGAVSFTNVGTVGIRGSESDPVTVTLTAGIPIAEWKVTENIPSGRTVELDFASELTDSLPDNTKFILTVSENDKSEYVQNPYTGTLTLFEVVPKPELSLDGCSVGIKEIESKAVELTLQYTLTNKGTQDAQGAALDIGYEYENGARTVLETVNLGSVVKQTSNTFVRTFKVKKDAFLETEKISGLSFFAELSSNSEEYSTSNNEYRKVVPHRTLFSAPANISMALGNTLYLPVAFTSTTASPKITAREIDAGTDGWEPLLGIIYFDESRGCIVAAPSRLGSGILQVEDQATNSIYAIGFTVTELGTGVNIYRNNEAFAFYEADGRSTVTNANNQDWSFPNEERQWNGNSENAYEAPMNNDLSVANRAGAYVSFETVADTLTIYFEGSITVVSDGFEVTVTSGSGTVSPITVSFGNADGAVHTVTITANTAGTKLDRYLATYADGVDPTPVKDNGSPNFYWSRSFPDTASMQPGEAVTITCYVTDDAALQSVKWNGAEPASLKKISDTLWSFDVTFTANTGGVPFEGSASDKVGNMSVCTVGVDWFNNFVSSDAIASAPEAPVLHFETEDGTSVESGKIHYYPYLVNTVSVPDGGSIAAYFSEAAFFTMSGELNQASDGRWPVTENGMFLVRITAKDGTWSQALIPMDQIEFKAPRISLSAAESAIQITVHADSKIASLTVNGYPVTGVNGTECSVSFPVTYGGEYTVVATDEQNLVSTQTVTISVPLVIDPDALTITPKVDQENGGIKVTVVLDPEGLSGGDYGTGSDPAKNNYVPDYQAELTNDPEEPGEEGNGMRAAANAQSAADTSTSDPTDDFTFVITDEGSYAVAVRSGASIAYTDTLTVSVDDKTTSEATCLDSAVFLRTLTVVYGENTYTDSAELVSISGPLGHDWGTPTYEWADDCSTVKATRACKRVESHVETETVKTSKEVTKPASCEEKGETTYTAVFENTAFTTQTKTVADINPTGHDYAFTEWTWDGFKSATATFTCSKDASHVVTVNTVPVETSRTEPTDTATGKIVYTATVIFEGNTYTAQKEDIIPAKGHRYGDPTWTWTGVESAKAVFVCDEGDDRQEINAAISSKTTPASCEEDGRILYTAAVFFGGKEYSDTKIVTLDKTGHDWSEPEFRWSDDGRTATAVQICRRDASHVRTFTAAVRTETMPSFGVGSQTTVCTATVVIDGKLYRDTITVTSPRLIAPLFPTEPHPTAPEDKRPENEPVLNIPGTAHPASEGLPFTDVMPGDWFWEDVKYVYENGIMNGVSATKFDPLSVLTRGMIVTVLYRMEGEPEVPEQGVFTDVPAGEWYSDGVSWAASKGIVNGYGNGKYGPTDNVTREQLAAILFRYANWKGYDTSVGEDTNILSYDDAFDISGWAVSAMQWACGTGVLDSGNTAAIRPTEPAARSEIARAIRVFCEEAVR